MEENINKALFAALRAAFSDKPVDDTEKEFLADKENLVKVLRLAQKHDVSQLVAMGIIKNDIIEKGTTNIDQVPLIAVYRYEKLNYELTRICNVFEKAKISFVPLKGSEIRKYYPNPWMRTSSDIDILVKKEDLRNAVSCLVKELQYSEHEQNEYDICLYSPSEVHVELHFGLIDDGISKEITKMLDDVWNYVQPKEGYTCYHEMTDEMFYFFHIAHMAKHLQIGGCGIRPFIDLWILDNIENINREKRDSLLKRGKLLKFSEKARRLSRVWLEGEECDAVTEKMQNFIISGGVHGNIENKILVQQQKKGGKVQYIISRIFLPYCTMKRYYPILLKHGWLLPFMHVYRWINLLIRGVAKETRQELEYSRNIPKGKADEAKELLREIGL